MEIPQEYQLICEGCGKTLDMRDASILSHGWIENGKIVCYDDEIIIRYKSSKKLGADVQWTANKEPINLN